MSRPRLGTAIGATSFWTATSENLGTENKPMFIFWGVHVRRKYKKKYFSLNPAKEYVNDDSDEWKLD